jgi:hypothetical protein
VTNGAKLRHIENDIPPNILILFKTDIKPAGSGGGGKRTQGLTGRSLTSKRFFLRKIGINALLPILFSAQFAVAQENTSSSKVSDSEEKAIVRHFLQDQEDIWTSAVGLRPKDAQWALGSRQV